MEEKIANIRAATLLELCREHKKNCDGDCNLSMFLMRDVYEDLIGRELTDEEKDVFT